MLAGGVPVGRVGAGDAVPGGVRRGSGLVGGLLIGVVDPGGLVAGGVVTGAGRVGGTLNGSPGMLATPT